MRPFLFIYSKIEILFWQLYIAVLREGDYKSNNEKMPTKKFVGRKINAGKFFKKLGRCDEDREVYTYEDSVLAPFLKNFLNNDVQLNILSFLKPKEEKLYEEDDNEYISDDKYDMYYDDFIIDEEERIQEQMERYEIINNKNLT